MTTYSLGIQGVGAQQKFGQKIDNIPDDVVPLGQTYTLAVATAGGMANCMRNNIPFLVKNARGETQWMVYDAERSTPTTPVLKRV